MAIQKGIIKFSGKLGDLIFYQSNQKALVRKGKTDDKVHNTAENSLLAGKDFGAASKISMYIRRAFAPLVVKYADRTTLYYRLNACLSNALNAISDEKLGHKKLMEGNISLLKGFEFNIHRSLPNLYYTSPIVSIEENGAVNIQIPKGEIESLFSTRVPNALTVCLKLMVFSFDLDGDNYETFTAKEIQISLAEPFEGRLLKDKIKIEYKGEKALLIALGVYYKDDYAQFINNRDFFTCQIIDAYHLRDGIIVPFMAPPAEEKTKDEEDTGLDWEIG
ncbi:MAG: hypothetical protein EOO90_30835 [Pedobacter sp.]|nr:MAG: hypothetical protein EOO90_30835 [Pedobacter sp.]